MSDATLSGEVAEWLKAAASKAVVLLLGYRGFESHPLRQLSLPPRNRGFLFVCWAFLASKPPHFY